MAKRVILVKAELTDKQLNSFQRTADKIINYLSKEDISTEICILSKEEKDLKKYFK